MSSRAAAPFPHIAFDQRSPRGYSTVADQAVEPIGTDRQCNAEDTVRPASALGLAAMPVGVALIRVENVYSFGWKMYNALHIRGSQEIQKQAARLNNWRWCPWVTAGPGRAARQHTRCRRCGWRRRDQRTWPRCPWVTAGPGRASRQRAERSSRRGCLAGGPPPTGTHSGPA